MLPFALGLFALFLPTHGAQMTAYNWSITDQSPLIAYTPNFRGGNDTTWNSTFSDSSWSKYLNGDWETLCGYGRSAHTSSLQGATATVRFIGTSVYVWGDAAQLSAVVYIDGIAQSTSGGDGGMIAAITGLTNDWHEVKVTPAGLMPVSVEGFTFTSQLEENPTNSTVNIPLAALRANLNVTGDWNLQYATVQDAITGKVINYTTVTTLAYGYPSLILQPPINTTMMFIYGLVSSFAGSYFVDIQPNQNATAPVPQNQTFNATMDWTTGDEVLYQAMLTPGVQHTVTIDLSEQGLSQGSQFAIGSIVYVQVPPRSSNGMSKGAIAAIVIVLAALVAAVFFLFFTARGRRLRSLFSRRPPPIRAGKVIDDNGSTVGANPSSIPLANMDHSKSEASLAPVTRPNLALPPLQIPRDASSHQSTAPSPSYGSTPMSPEEPISPTGATRSEKEESMAALLPHLISSVAPSGQAGSPSTRRLLTPLRDVDAGPIAEESESPMLPPEYQPSWAAQRNAQERR